MKFIICMFVILLAGIGMLEAGQQTAQVMLSRAGFVALILGFVGVMADIAFTAAQHDCVAQ